MGEERAGRMSRSFHVHKVKKHRCVQVGGCLVGQGSRICRNVRMLVRLSFVSMWPVSQFSYLVRVLSHTFLNPFPCRLCLFVMKSGALEVSGLKSDLREVGLH